MALPLILPPSNHVLIGTDETPEIPKGTAEKRFYDWLLAVQRILSGRGGLIGSTDGSDAAAGEVGEIIQSEVTQGAPVAFTNGAPGNVTQLTLTPGDWRVFWAGKLLPAAGTTIFGANFSISTASATPQSSPESRSSFLPVPNAGLLGGGNYQIMILPVGPTRISVAVNTVVYAVGNTTFTGGTLSGYGHLWAERRR